MDKVFYKNSDLKNKRIDLWIGVCIGVASANNCNTSQAPIRYANAALIEFDKIFPGEEINFVGIDKPEFPKDKIG